MHTTHHIAHRIGSRTTWLALLAAFASAAALTIAAPPASAAPIDSGSFDFTDSSTFDDCGYEIREDSHAYGVYTTSQGTKKTGGEFFRFRQRIAYEGTFTNVATGAYFTEEWHTNWREMPATLVAGSDSVVTYQTKESGVWDTIRDSSGKVRYRSAGNLVWSYVFDTGGDGAPGGEFISDEFIRTSGNWQTFDVDFCDIADELIG
jgi:hypothetical protein